MRATRPARAREALKQAIAAYRGPYEQDPRRTPGTASTCWRCSPVRDGSGCGAPDLKPQAIARALVTDLGDAAEAERVAPADGRGLLGLQDWATVERNIYAYAADENAKAFLIASTLRQFTQVWDIEATDDRGRQLVNILRARLAELPDGKVEIGAPSCSGCSSSPSRTKASSRRCWARRGRRRTDGGRPGSTGPCRWRRFITDLAVASAPAFRPCRGPKGNQPMNCWC